MAVVDFAPLLLNDVEELTCAAQPFFQTIILGRIFIQSRIALNDLDFAPLSASEAQTASPLPFALSENEEIAVALLEEASELEIRIEVDQIGDISLVHFIVAQLGGKRNQNHSPLGSLRDLVVNGMEAESEHVS